LNFLGIIKEAIMDSSKIPSDSSSDSKDAANSLEAKDTVIETDGSADDKDKNTSSTVIDAAGGSGNAGGSDASPSGEKPPLLKRLWRKFNIYLLLFILVILIAAGVTVGLFIKDRRENKTIDATINAQTLSDSALKQLANSDVTVGNSKQVLKVESNAVFSGSVLVRNDLEVAGTIKVGGELQLPGITVSGSSRFNQLQADNLTIGSNATVQGTLVAKKGIAVTGNSTFDGISAAQITTTSFQLNGELKLTNHITAGGPNPGVNRGNAVGSGGTASVSGSDTTGSIVINTGSGTGAGCFATITFAKKFNSTPHIIVTPVGSGAAAIDYYINRSSSDFSVCTTNPAPSGQTFGFDYIVLN
jgi:cytoskeletal protein CcmA (bactofilin family)